MFNYLINIAIDAPDTGAGFNDVSDFLGVALNIALGSGIAISVIALIMSGIQFMTSKGDPKAVEKARKALTYSVVAVVLTMGAFTAKLIVFNLTGVDPSQVSNALPDF